LKRSKEIFERTVAFASVRKYANGWRTGGAVVQSCSTCYGGEKVSVDGGAAQTLSFTPTGSFTTVGAMTVSLSLAAGSNTIEFANPAAYAPDLNEIIVAHSP
jgi:hypothetical protein